MTQIDMYRNVLLINSRFVVVFFDFMHAFDGIHVSVVDCLEIKVF